MCFCLFLIVNKFECESIFVVVIKIGRYFFNEIVYFRNKFFILIVNIFLIVVFVGKYFEYRNIFFKYFGEIRILKLINFLLVEKCYLIKIRVKM